MELTILDRLCEMAKRCGHLEADNDYATSELERIQEINSNLRADNYDLRERIQELEEEFEQMREAMRDHPVIRNLEETGYPDGELPVRYMCPVCGDECERYYTDGSGVIQGCESCIDEMDAADYEEQFGR
jgi:regulator of replication initiation timing